MGIQKDFLNFIVKVLDRFPCLGVTIVNVETLGRRQVVRQLVLVQPFRGSNPFAPVKVCQVNQLFNSSFRVSDRPTREKRLPKYKPN